MRRRFRFRREEGASLVEVSLILPLLIILAIGLAEIGFLVIDYITVSNAARSGARTGSSAANATDADDLILNVVEEAACNLRFGDLVSVTIYRPLADGSKPMVGATPDFSLTNVYTPSGPLRCRNDAHALNHDAGTWNSAGRNRVPPDFDTIGIEVVFSHTGVTGLFPFPTMEWTETAIMQLEPDLRN